MPQASAIVRRIVEQNGEFLVSFHGHDGYFKVPDGPQAADLRDKVRHALQNAEPLTFTYDTALNILNIT